MVMSVVIAILILALAILFWRQTLAILVVVILIILLSGAIYLAQLAQQVERPEITPSTSTRVLGPYNQGLETKPEPPRSTDDHG